MKYLWAVYVGTLLIIGGSQSLYKVSSDSGGFISQFGPLTLAILLAVGVLGKLQQKPVFYRAIWRGLFWSMAASIPGLIGLSIYQLINSVNAGIPVVFFILAILLIPATRQLFHYAYRSPRAWGD